LNKSDLVYLQLPMLAVGIAPGVALAQRNFILALVLIGLFGAAHFRIPLIQRYYTEFKTAPRYALVVFFVWTIGGLVASINDAMRLLGVLALLVFTFFFSLFARPRSGTE
jgi:hypothetical protein